MIEVFRSRDAAIVGPLQGILESEGIQISYRNENLSTTAVPLPEFTPALCILDEGKVDRGVELIRAHVESSGDETGRELSCPECGEAGPATFAECWNCGATVGDGPD